MSLINKKSLKQFQKAFKGVKFLKKVYTYEDFMKNNKKMLSDVNKGKMSHLKEFNEYKKTT